MIQDLINTKGNLLGWLMVIGLRSKLCFAFLHLEVKKCGHWGVTYIPKRALSPHRLLSYKSNNNNQVNILENSPNFSSFYYLEMGRGGGVEAEAAIYD